MNNLFYILWGHFDKNKNGGPTLPGGRVSRRVRGRMQPFQLLDIVSRHFEKKKKICILWSRSSYNMFESSFSFCIRVVKFIYFFTFVAKFTIFAYFLIKSHFFRSAILWCHNYVTPLLMVLILIIMYGQRKSIPIFWYQNMFIAGSVATHPSPLARRNTRIPLLDKG